MIFDERSSSTGAASTTARRAFTVDDIEGTLERLRARGAEVEAEPHLIFEHDDDTLGPAGAEEWMAFVRDSEGNTVGLVEHRSRG